MNHNRLTTSQLLRKMAHFFCEQMTRYLDSHTRFEDGGRHKELKILLFPVPGIYTSTLLCHSIHCDLKIKN